ncbi:hypothetical protein OROMI_000983 [Orobanche minor]
MVLSNKKLKEKLRAAKAEVVVATEAVTNLIDRNVRNSHCLDFKASQSLITTLNLEAPKSKLSKREKLRQKAQKENSEIIKNGETSGDAEVQKPNGSRSDAEEVKKKKRKRDESDKKLRAAKAEGIVATEAVNNLTDKNSGNSHDLDSKAWDIILNPEAQKSNLFEREKQRRKAQQENPEITKNGDISGDAESKIQNGSESDAGEVKKKKKRKRDESDASENVKEKKPMQMKKKKKKKKKKHKKADNGKVREEGVEQRGSRATGEQLVAMLNESAQRKISELSDKVYVGGIPYYSTEDDIRSYFEGCGTITGIDCMTFPDTGKFRGIAIITFKTEAAAKRALARDGSDMGGLFLKIQAFKSSKVNKLSNFSPSVMEGYNRIYVGNLSWDVTEDDLRKLFAGCTIESIRFGEDKETGEFKGYAHVDFGDSLSLNKSLKLDQKIVCGRPVRISCAVPKKGNATNLNLKPKDNQVSGGHANGVQVTASSEADAVISSKVMAITTSEANSVISKFDTSSEAVAVSSKIRRRTCYECGERGHISSLCQKIVCERPVRISCAVPKKGNTTNLNLKPKDNQVRGGAANGVQVTVISEAHAAISSEVIATTTSGADAINSRVDMSSEAVALCSKIRRRTCYECGERGHISSLCPKIKADDLINPGAS